ncbi:MAG: tetratricopeptide (TPR) repeat protein, partial [Bradymonadia bacterium]
MPELRTTPLPAPKMTQTSAAPRALAALCDAALAVTAIAVAMLPLSGFVRYEIPQLAVATLAGVLATAAWLRIAIARETLLSRGSTWTVFAVLAVVGFAFARAVFAPAQSGDAWESVALLWLLVPFALVAAAKPAADTGRLTLYGLTLALVVGALVSVAQRSGAALPETIPFTTHPTGFGRSLFDDAATAGAWFALAGLAASTLANRRNASAFAAIATVSAAIGVGLAGAGAPMVLFAAGLLINLAASAARGPKAIGVTLAGVIVATATAFVPPAEVEQGFVNAQLGLLDTGQTWPLDNLEAREALSAAERETALANVGIGAGAGRYSDMVLPQIENETGFGVGITNGLKLPHRGVSPAMEWTVEFGVVVPLLILLVLFVASPWRMDTGSAGTRLVAIALVIVGSSGVSPAFVVGLGLVLLATAENSKDEPSGSPLPALALPLFAMGFALLVMQPNTLRWAYNHALSVNLVGNDQFEAAIEATTAANDAQTRAGTLTNLGALTLLTTNPETRPVASAMPHLRTAMTMATGAPVPRFIAARAAIRQDVDSPEQLAERSDTTVRLLLSVVEIDPNFILAYEEAANIMLAGGRTAEAAELLERAAARPVSSRALAPLNMSLGRVYDNFMQDPVKALVAYERAVEGFQGRRELGNAIAQLQRMEAWVETGSRPMPVQGHDDHAGHGHGPGEHDYGNEEPAGAHDGEAPGA